jgi:uncharacterized membrane protein YgcG
MARMLVQVRLYVSSISNLYLVFTTCIVNLKLYFCFAAACLHPRHAYLMEPTPEMFRSLKDTFQSMTDLQTAVQALQEAEVFRRKHGDFAQEIARRAAIDPKTSPCKINSVQPLLFPLLQMEKSLVTNSVPLSHAYAASWWMMFGSSTPALQKLALRLVSQCVSSSGCERNWSTFALLHTKVRNRLTHKKLNKLVYVNYNLRLRLKELNNPPRDEGDFIDHLAHLTFYDEHNPVREWMEYGRSNEAPVLDEDDDDDGDVPLPSHIIRDHIDPSALRDATGDECISDWARRTVGNTHLGKRKLQKGPQKDDSKRQRKAIPVSSDTSTDDGDGQRSPPYQESQDSSSAEDGDDSDGDGGGGGGGGVDSAGGSGGGGGGSGGGGGGGGLRFIGINCICTYICTYVY